MGLHAIFAYPWNTNRFSDNMRPDLRKEVKMQITKSSEAMVIAARNIIVMARCFDINGANTHAYATPFYTLSLSNEIKNADNI